MADGKFSAENQPRRRRRRPKINELETLPQFMLAPEINFEILDFFMRRDGSRGRRLIIEGFTYRKAITWRQAFNRWGKRLNMLELMARRGDPDAVQDREEFVKFFTQSSDIRVKPSAINMITVRILPPYAPPDEPVEIELERKFEWSVGRPNDLECAEPFVIHSAAIAAGKLFEGTREQKAPEITEESVWASGEVEALMKQGLSAKDLLQIKREREEARRRAKEGTEQEPSSSSGKGHENGV